VHKVQIASIPSSPFMSFPRSLLTSRQHMREMSMCVERKDLCVCICLVWLGLYGIRLCHISINPQWIHIVIALPPPPLRLLRAAIRRVRLIDIRINTRPAHSTGGQTSGQLRERETLMTRQHPAGPAHRVTSSSLFLGRFLFWGILFLAGEEEK
jgi:hypothetical protein